MQRSIKDIAMLLEREIMNEPFIMVVRRTHTLIDVLDRIDVLRFSPKKRLQVSKAF